MTWDRKFWYVRIRGKEYLMLPGVRIPQSTFILILLRKWCGWTPHEL